MDIKNCFLGDIVQFQRGYDLPKRKMTGTGFPVIGSNGIIGFHSQFTTNNPSITIGRSGNVGKPYIFYGKTWSHNTTLFIKKFTNCDPVFIYYLLKTLDLAKFAGGSAVPTLNRNHIQSLPVKVPKNLCDQKKIGQMLKTIDNKIAINDAINKNLSV